MRLGTYSARYGILPPAAMVATRAQAADPRAAPRYGERIPYVVVYGEPGARGRSVRSCLPPVIRHEGLACTPHDLGHISARQWRPWCMILLLLVLAAHWAARLRPLRGGCNAHQPAMQC